MRRVAILLAFMTTFCVYGQDSGNILPDSVKYVTIVGPDTIHAHYDSIKPASFTYSKVFYYPSKTRVLPVIKGCYENQSRIGDWAWYTKHNNLLESGHCIISPYVFAQYTLDSVKIRAMYTSAVITKHLSSDSITGTIYPEDCLETRFVLANGRCQFQDLNIEEVSYGHFIYLEDVLMRIQADTGIELLRLRFPLNVHGSGTS